MEHPIRLKLAREVLLDYLANHYTSEGTHNLYAVLKQKMFHVVAFEVCYYVVCVCVCVCIQQLKKMD